MKSTILIILFLSGGISLLAQGKADNDGNKKINVPEAVSRAFHKDFPDVKNVEWGRERKEYEGEFILNGTEASANYDKTGHRTELELAIKNEELPSAVTDYIMKNYSDYRVKESAKVVSDKNITTYEVQVIKGSIARELVFNKDGNFLKAGRGETD
jgi:hypothetical protein